MNLERTKTVFEIVKNTAEIIALIVAGLWAYTQFEKNESPSLELRAFSESDLKWYQTPESDRCLGRFGVSIKNIGKESFDISNATMRVWLVDSALQSQVLSYLDPKQFQKGTPYFEKFFTDSSSQSLLGHFPPSVTEQYHFTFNFKKTSPKFALFSLDAIGSGIAIHESRWSYICDIEEQHS